MPERGAPEVVCEPLRPEDRAELVALARRVFVETDAQKRDVFEDDFWTWQYASGYSANLNVVARVENAIAGSYPNLLLPILYRGQRALASVCQDLHTAAEYRGLGLFARMGDLAFDLLRERGVAISYAFPNPRSIGGFLRKHGHTLVAEVPLLLRPILPALPGPKRFSFERLGVADDLSALDTVWSAFARGLPPIALIRDASFVRWRFLERPRTSYELWLLRESGQAVGWVALRAYRLFGLPVCLLMDFAAVGPTYVRPLLRAAERRARELHAVMMVTILLSSVEMRRAFTRRLYLPVPSRLNRRRFNFVARANLPEIDPALIAESDNWHVTFADWDVF